MTSSDFDSLIRSYGKWLSDNTTYTQLDEWYEVNVPLLDEDNDYTQFYVKPGKNSVTFSDDCATSRRLESHGMTVTESRLAVLKDILNQFGIERNGDELTLTSDTADFADAKNRFLQAIIKVGDMSMLANPMCRRILQMIFVCSLMRTNIRYVEGAQFRGKSGLLCQYDFVLPFTSKQTERFCTSITRPSQRLISSTLFSWEDTQAARKTPSELVVFLNDSDRRIDNQLITALEKYNAYPIKWSEREFKENLYKLAS